MREILFRGKRVDNGEWVYGTLIQRNICGDVWEVIPETGGQYTGLDDKNGVKIFEGDIHEYDGRHFAVKFGYYTDDDTNIEMYGWYLDSNSLEEQGSLGVDSEKYVNIIHDNPKLMEVTK